MQEVSLERGQLPDHTLRSISSQLRKRPRMWTNDEMQAVLDHLIYQRKYMKEHGLEVPEVYTGDPTEDWHLP